MNTNGYKAPTEGTPPHISKGESTRLQDRCNRSLDRWRTPVLLSVLTRRRLFHIRCIQSYTEAIGNNGLEESDVTQITPFVTMCPSTVWCRRGDRTIAPLSDSPQIGCDHLRLPLSIHRGTWVVCGLPEPTSISSRKALCYTGVVLSTLSVLVCSGL